ncbi:alcohol dehydrogenase [Burkholderia stagnalis]|uniref:Cytochrome c n=1 Tax=Burkholderia stagnalis TaxID=1503054 RepID=A0A6L3MRS7_9BURK|nr:cytochrome c [Burkholderia stagnalis]KAB0633691.1 cytochrome c [Burkholderia stagnalis]KVO43002.1 alcohol dehydrogenase [Burkholderia stagnalis]KVO65706.1 alcohol dehydrogenase [Burkholderia stagnalis]KVW59612.1 alcohol dehydrogenase [Burkholderia stagnalis]KVW81150.1 alcohol dehydrogenase [Burkholderia stagnalis]
MKRTTRDNAARRTARVLAAGAAWLAFGLASGAAIAQPAAAPVAGASASAAPAPAPASATSAAPQSANALVARGAYLARAGDCVACHTASGGKPFAGGLKFDTPIGAIYSTNITPDPRTGLGGWTLEEFDRALRAGVRKNGDTLYPAMPFPSYARLTGDDVKALYAYFMHGVAPVQQENRPVDIVWPLSMRWPLGFWRKLFAPTPKPFDAAPYPDPVLARGAYLVQGLGHCGACHTPRAPTMQERGLTDADGPDFLAGGAAIDGWVPTSLRGEPRTGFGAWTEAEIVQFLKTGRTARTAAFGGMTDVVGHSMQHLTDDDLTAIARYLKTLPPKVQGETPYAYDAAAAKALQAGDASKPGAAVYRDNCMACHRSDGRGYTRVFPALGGNPVVQGDDPTSVIHVVLAGSALKGTHTAPSTFTMPPFGWRLSDQEVADVANFVRTSWGNTGSPVTAAQVAKVRKATPGTRPEPPPGARYPQAAR